MFKTVYEDGYSWVEITDEDWARATLTFYYYGQPVHRRKASND